MVNTSSQFGFDTTKYLDKTVLPLARRYMAMYDLSEPHDLPPGGGTTFNFIRFPRLRLPTGPLLEGVPPDDSSQDMEYLTVSAQQWGAKLTVTDWTELVIFHPILENIKKTMALQIGETLERNAQVVAMSGTQVSYVAQRGSRGALLPGDALGLSDIKDAATYMKTYGVPYFMGSEITDQRLDAKAGGARASANPRTRPHLVCIGHPNVIDGDLSSDSTFVLATSYSDINRLYNQEVGQYADVRFISSNMVPVFTGYAAVSGTASATGGTLATGTYYIMVVGQEYTSRYETRLCQVSGPISVTGPTGSISVTLPSDSAYSYNVYIGTSTSIANLATSSSGPTNGYYSGQAWDLAPGSTVVLKSIGSAKIPPAAPATGVTVYPTFIFGQGAMGTLRLDDVKTNLLDSADRVDPLNQTRVVSWKFFNSSFIKNDNFMQRIESVSNARPPVVS